jgi:LuxR family maltose regulon positive regulatory protein
MLDDAERLPASSAQLLAYLMHNAPPNLHLVVGSRVPLAVATAELSAKGNLALLQAADLRLRQDESIEILLRRFGARIGLDDCVRVHEATEGWPIGLQLAAASIERSGNCPRRCATLSGRPGDIGEYFMTRCSRACPSRLATFLVHDSILERLSVDLCEAVTCCGIRPSTSTCSATRRPSSRLPSTSTGCACTRCARLPAGALRAAAAGDRARSSTAAPTTTSRAPERFHEAACHALAAGDLSATESHARARCGRSARRAA